MCLQSQLFLVSRTDPSTSQAVRGSTSVPVSADRDSPEPADLQDLPHTVVHEKQAQTRVLVLHPKGQVSDTITGLA